MKRRALGGWVAESARLLRESIGKLLLCSSFSREESKAKIASIIESQRLSAFKVSVIIPVNNGMAGARIPRLLDSLASQSHGNIEVIAVDSGSTDGTPEFLLSRGVQVLHIAASDFRHDRSRNLGARAAQGEFLLFTVADAVFDDSEWLRIGIAHLVEWEGTSFSSPQICPNDAPLFSRYLAFKHLNSLRVGAGVQRFGFARSSLIARLAYAIAPMAMRERVIRVDDTNHLVRRKTFERFGFRMHTCEDMVFGYDLIRSGGVFIYSGLTGITHFHTYDDPVRFFRRCAADYQVHLLVTHARPRRLTKPHEWDRAFCLFALLIGNIQLALDAELPPGENSLTLHIAVVDGLYDKLHGTCTKSITSWMRQLLQQLKLPVPEVDLTEHPSGTFQSEARNIIGELGQAIRVLEKMGIQSVGKGEVVAFLLLCALNLMTLQMARRLHGMEGGSPLAVKFQKLAWA